MAAAQTEAVEREVALLRKALGHGRRRPRSAQGCRLSDRGSAGGARPRVLGRRHTRAPRQAGRRGSVRSCCMAGRRPTITLTTSATTGSGCTSCRRFGTIPAGRCSTCTTRSCPSPRASSRIRRNCSPPRGRLPGEDRLRVLCPADMVLHSATHLFHNEDLSQGLRDLADLDSLLRHFGQEPGFWEELPRRAAELDLARPLYYGLRYATRVPGHARTARDAPPAPTSGATAANGRPPDGCAVRPGVAAGRPE